MKQDTLFGETHNPETSRLLVEPVNQAIREYKRVAQITFYGLENLSRELSVPENIETMRRRDPSGIELFSWRNAVVGVKEIYTTGRVLPVVGHRTFSLGRIPNVYWSACQNPESFAVAFGNELINNGYSNYLGEQTKVLREITPISIARRMFEINNALPLFI